MGLYGAFYGELFGQLYGDAVPGIVVPVDGAGDVYGRLYGRYFGRYYGRALANVPIVNADAIVPGLLRARSALPPLSTAHEVVNDGTRARSA